LKRIRWRPETHADFDEIWRFIAREDIFAAYATVDRIVALAELLRRHPEAGSSVPDLPDVLSRSLGAYRLFYRYKDDFVLVLAVRHGARRFMKIVAARLDD
jgi:plasmid stabilization system protein ParE